MKRIILVLFLAGCFNQEDKIYKPPSICLYPGYLAKSNGSVVWFPERPYFDGDDWRGINPTIVTSCIYDPWPHTQGGEPYLMRIEQ